MIRHIVLVKFPPDAEKSEIDAVFAELSGLVPLVPGMLSFHAGENVSPEGLGRGYSHGFVADFADAAARDRYLEHPAHRAAGARLVRTAEGGLDGILVIDLEMQGR